MEERTIPCERCGSDINVRLFSSTLSQVVKCQSCGARFNYDPQKVPVPRPEPVKEEPTSVPSPTPAPLPAPEEQPPAPTPSPEPPEEETEEGMQELACPDCGKEFKVQLPAKKKATGKTMCPDCSAIFSFARVDWEESDHGFATPAPKPADPQTEEKQESQKPESEFAGLYGDMDRDQSKDWPEKSTPPLPGIKDGKQDISCPMCDFQFDVVLPAIKKREVLTLCPLCQHEFSFQRAAFFYDDTADSPEKKAASSLSPPPPPPPPSPSAAPSRPEEMGYGGDDKPVPEGFVGKKLAKGKAVAGSFLDFDVHSIKESLLPANLAGQARSKLGMAAILLLVVFLLGLGNAIVTLGFGLSQDAQEGLGSKVTIAGTVYFETDTVEGAQVTLSGRNGTYTTNSQGRFWLENVSAGKATITVTHPDYGSSKLTFEVKDRQGELPREMDVQLPGKSQESSRDISSDDDGGLSVIMVFTLLFLVLLVASLFAFFGAVSCLLSKNFQTAKYGAFVGILSFGFLIGSLLAIVALILILLARKDFERTSFLEDEEGESPTGRVGADEDEFI